MRFGLAISHQGLARALSRDHRSPGSADATVAALRRLTDLAVAAEAGGASTVWATEDPDGWDAFAVLTAIAGRTSTIGLATAVTSPLLRHPNLIAASTATLDLVSGGRATLGMGRGEPDWYRAGLGVAVPASPAGALAEAIRLVRRWWQPPYRVTSGQEGDDEATAFPVRDWERTIGPWPGRPGGPPVIVAAAGQRALRIAGELADGVMFNDLASDEWLRGAVATVRDAASAAGRDPAALRFIYNTPVQVTDDPEPVLLRRRGTVATINALPGMDRQLVGAGIDIDPMIAAVRAAMRSDEVRRDGGGFAAVRRFGDLERAVEQVPVDLIERLSVIGPPARVRERLATLAEIGIGEVMVAQPAAGQSAETLAGTIEALRALAGDAS